MRYWKECGSFIREFRRSVQNTGAVLPSSRFLAHALVSRLRQPRPASRILEVGPGTGSVTRAIARCMLADDRLDAVELNSCFVGLLRQRVQQEPVFGPVRPHIEVIHAPVQELVGDGVYDFIISGLPLNNFPVGQVREIFKAYIRLLKPGGTLSYYEYAFIRQLKTPFVNRRERRRLYRVGRLVRRYIQAYQVGHQQVLMNVPPAVVRHLWLKPCSNGSARPNENRRKAVLSGARS